MFIEVQHVVISVGAQFHSSEVSSIPAHLGRPYLAFFIMSVFIYLFSPSVINRNLTVKASYPHDIKIKEIVDSISVRSENIWNQNTVTIFNKNIYWDAVAFTARVRIQYIISNLAVNGRRGK